MQSSDEEDSCDLEKDRLMMEELQKKSDKLKQKHQSEMELLAARQMQDN